MTPEVGTLWFAPNPKVTLKKKEWMGVGELAKECMQPAFSQVVYIETNLCLPQQLN